MEELHHLNYGELLYHVDPDQRTLLRQLEKKEKSLLSKVSAGQFNKIYTTVYMQIYFVK
jgi:FixJ family two-component response regulator